MYQLSRNKFINRFLLEKSKNLWHYPNHSALLPLKIRKFAQDLALKVIEKNF